MMRLGGLTTGVKIPGRKMQIGEWTVEGLMKVIPKDLALRVAYLPIVIQELVAHYALSLVESCRALRVHKREGRRIRELLGELDWETYGLLSRGTVNRFRGGVQEFMQETGMDLYKLYLSINSELKRRYPDLETEEYDMLTNAMLVGGFCEYYRWLGGWIVEVLRRVTHTDFSYPFSVATMGLMKEAMAVLGGHDVEQTGIIALALKIVKQKIEAIDFNLVDR